MNYWPQQSVTAAGTISVQLTDRVFWCDTTLGNQIFNLPVVTGKAALYFVFKKVSVDSNTVTVNPPAGKTIDGLSSYVLTFQNQIIGIAVDTTGNYFIVDGNSSGAAVGQGRVFIEKTDGNVGLSSSAAAITGMTQSIQLDVGGNVIISVSGSYSFGGQPTTAIIGIDVDGTQYTWTGDSSNVGSGGDFFNAFAMSHTMGINLTKGAHVIKFLAGGQNATLLCGTTATPASLVIQYPTVVNFGGGNPTGDPTNDLSGTWQTVQVVGLQNDKLPSKIANGYLKRNINNTAWILDPTMLTVLKGGSVVHETGQLNFIDQTNITTTITYDITNQKVDVAIQASGSGGGSSVITNTDDMWQKTFWTDEGLLPTTKYIARLEDFGSWDFENGGVILDHYKSRFRSAGTGSTIHFAFNTGGSRSKIFFLIGLVKSTASFAGFYVNDAADSNGDVAGNGYHASIASDGTFTWFREDAGAFNSPTTTVFNDNVGAVTGRCIIYDGVAGKIQHWVRIGAENWWKNGEATDSTYATMKNCGIRCFSSGLMFNVSPVVIYYT